MTTTDTPVPLLSRARAAMRGLAEVERGLAEVAERLRRARGAPRPEDDIVEQVLPAILGGDPVPDDLAAQVLTVRRGNEGAMAEAQALGRLERRLRERLRAIHIERADDALDVLRVELDEVLSQARPVLAELGTADSAEAAIASDRVDAWRQVTTLAERYAAMRSAQCVITSGSVTPVDNRVTSVASKEARLLVADYGTVRDPDKHYAELGDVAVQRVDSQIGGVRIVDGRVVETTRTEKPARRRPWISESDLDNLRFVVRGDVTAWVPGIAALLAERDAHQARRRAEARVAGGGPADERSPGSLIQRSGRDPRARVIRP